MVANRKRKRDWLLNSTPVDDQQAQYSRELFLGDLYVPSLDQTILPLLSRALDHSVD